MKCREGNVWNRGKPITGGESEGMDEEKQRDRYPHYLRSPQTFQTLLSPCTVGTTPTPQQVSVSAVSALIGLSYSCIL